MNSTTFVVWCKQCTIIWTSHVKTIAILYLVWFNYYCCDHCCDGDDDDDDDDDEEEDGFCTLFGGLNDSKMWT